MKLLAALLSITLLAAPAAAATSRWAPSAPGAGLASESTYAANNPVKHTDRNGMLPDDSPGWDRLAAAQLGMSGGEKAAQGRMAVSMMPAAGDFIAAAISIGEAILSPSMANTETAGWDSLGAALPFVPAVGTLKRVGDAVEAAGDVTAAAAKQLDAPAMGAQLAESLGKNRVTIQTPSKTIDIDLQGKPHFDKKTGKQIDTPHVKETPKTDRGPDLKRRTTRPATKDDIRTAREAEKRRE